MNTNAVPPTPNSGPTDAAATPAMRDSQAGEDRGRNMAGPLNGRKSVLDSIVEEVLTHV